MWNKKRFSAIEKRLKQLECPHENIDVLEWWDDHYAVCKDCGKIVASFNTLLEREEYRKTLETSKRKRQEAEYKKSMDEIDGNIEGLKESGHK